MLEQEEYEDLGLIRRSDGVQWTGTDFTLDKSAIRTIVRRCVDQVYPQLSRTWARQTVDEIDRDIKDVVEFVDRQVYPPE